MQARARLAIVGRRADLGTCLPPAGLEALEIGWVERPAGPDHDRLAQALARLRPDVVVALEPEPGEGAVVSAAGRPSVAWLVADLGPDAVDRVACAGFERLVAASPAAARRAGSVPAWRIAPLPVADACFATVGAPGSPPRVFFDGPASERRDEILQPTKHAFDVLHLAGGGSPERLRELQGRCDIALDLREEPGLPPRDRVGTALAAGLLVVAELPVDRPGLTPGADLLTFDAVPDLHELLAGLRRHPESMHTIRVRGRRRAEALRASVVLPQLVADVLASA